MKQIYLDNNSTTQLDERVFEKMKPFFLESYGNPSSVHSIGQKNRKYIEESRETIANILGVNPGEIIFTSGGTEANNMAVRGVAHNNSSRGKHIITSTIEHPSILNTFKALEEEGFKVSFIDIKEDGIIDLEQLTDEITNETTLISIMHANNEIGTIQPIEEIKKIIGNRKIFLHSDAVQSVGKLNVKPKEIGLDMMSFSGHKFYGPKGIGALYLKNGIKLKKTVTGGHQERNRRPGTENVPAIIGMAEALNLAVTNLEKDYKHTKELRDYLESELEKMIPEVIVNGDRQKRLPSTLSLTIKYVEGESILLNLDMKGIAVSSGSACTSGSLEPSHVVLALGVPMEHAHGTLRFSIGRFNTREEIEYVLETLPEIVDRIRSMSPFWNN